jgi:hypothetical protein
MGAGSKESLEAVLRREDEHSDRTGGVLLEAAIEEGVDGLAGQVDGGGEPRTVVGVHENEGVDVDVGDGLRVKRHRGPGDRGPEGGREIRGRSRRKKGGVDRGRVRDRRGRGGDDGGRGRGYRGRRGDRGGQVFR